MSGRDIVVIGASAGGVTALLDIACALPGGLQATLFVVVHSSPDAPTQLPAILSKAGPLPATLAVDGDRFRSGRFYIAPPDRHLLLDGDRMSVTRGPRENGFRPAVDPLFRTAALQYGSRVTGIILSGGLDDGTHGLRLVKEHGGVTIVQDENDALIPSMPVSAIQNVEVDHVLPASEMAPVITRLARGRRMAARPGLRLQTPDVAERGAEALHGNDAKRPPSPFTCPECGGALWDLVEDDLHRFRCRVGHSFGAESLLARKDGGVEAALWTALRTLEETGLLRRRMAERTREGGLAALARSYEMQAEEADRQAAAVRALLVRESGEVPEDIDDTAAERKRERRVASRRGGNNR